jgi:hypothetical protein
LYILMFMFSDSRRNRWEALDWMVPSIIQIQSDFKYLLTKTLISYCRSQVFELCHIFKEYVSYFYVMILPCILLTRQQHTLSFLCT